MDSKKLVKKADEKTISLCSRYVQGKTTHIRKIHYKSSRPINKIPIQAKLDF